MSRRRPAGRTRRAAVVVTLTVATLTAAGCGAVMGGPSTAPDGTALPGVDELYSTTRAASLGARTGHVSGFMTVDDETFMIDIEGRLDGKNQRTTFTTDRGAFTILVVKGEEYLSGDWDFWAAETDPKTANALVGKHVVMPPSEMPEYVDWSIGGLIEGVLGVDELPLVDRVGASVVTRVQEDRQLFVGKPRSFEFWVDQDTRRLVRIVHGGDEPGELSFDRWDEVEKFTAPKGSTRLGG